MKPRPVTTVEEYEKCVMGVDRGVITLLQLGADSCVRCPGFRSKVERLVTRYQFEWLYCDAHDADTDLPGHFNVSQLPAFVCKGPGRHP